MAPQAVKPEAVLYGVIGGFLTIPLVLGYVFGWYAAVAVIMLWYAPFPSFVKRYSVNFRFLFFRFWFLEISHVFFVSAFAILLS
eukprot:m.36630 g.36630  ORF g.36630 m.36630 type:complete len:84 (-) comp5426_c0_seq1:43-294(-)